jgi:8-oxo-dGTP pyrophosphatase MutT (NUDIX family)
MADITKAGLLVVRERRILLCRKKRGTSLLILPGGRVEPEETPLECLHREIKEELGGAQLESVSYLAAYSDRAAGEPNKMVEILLYTGELRGDPRPSSEIGELIWFSKEEDWSQLAPSLRNKILPDVERRGLWS